MKKNIFSLFPTNLHHQPLTHLLKERKISLSGLGNATSKAFFGFDCYKKFKPQLFLWVTNSEEESTAIAKSLEFWGLDFVQTWQHSPLEEDKNEQTNLKILSLLYQQKTSPLFVLANRSAFLSTLPTPEEQKLQSINLFPSLKISSFDCINFLIENGYSLNSDPQLLPNQYHQEGGILTIFPLNSPHPLKIEFEGDQILNIYLYNQTTKKIISELSQALLWPANFSKATGNITHHLPAKTLLLEDELDIEDHQTDHCLHILKNANPTYRITFTSFPDDNDPNFFHLQYLSLLRFHNFYDLVNDLREKKQNDWRCIISTRRLTEIKNILLEEKLTFTTGFSQEPSQIHLIDASHSETVPHSFQNTTTKIELLTDREIVELKRRTLTNTQRKVYLDFLTKLRTGDYVVHIDHGIGIFLGTEKHTIDDITREYLRLGYAQGDRLFVPIDQADKINKYIGQEDSPPRLNRLGSAEWKTITNKVKKETSRIAEDLLKLYAARAASQGFPFSKDTPEQTKFESAFPYQETPGQVRALQDVKKDMETKKQMDRLICGDVGFGKTEVALRAAFKAIQSGRQVAFISPITILADQHYKTCLSRFEKFAIKVEMLSRFRTVAEQKKILTDLAKGKIDLIIGTHRLLQPDVKFKNLGLLIVDEEQRFGVKQKEALKRLRKEIDILTLTATPIPRTLNMALHGIRDISTITTPPPGRLPVITEVRRFSQNLIKTVIEKELERNGQIYFLHNRVQTIESMAEKLRTLVPSGRVIVGHGKLSSTELEKRIMAFKKGEYDILVSSTIIENGIDLPNANTLIVNNADQFGLSQLYQLRGRVGRGKSQAYAYFLYQAQRLTLESKKRLRAIVEAAELGSGFQIAMRDLEIRGAGDILGVNQHGAINVVGVTHFVRLLRQSVEELKSGKASSPLTSAESESDITIEIPISGYIPEKYIEDSRDKINAYQRLSAADTFSSLDELREDLEAEYGPLPKEVRNLFRVLELKILARRAGVTNIRSTNLGGGKREIALSLSKKIKPENIFNLISNQPKWFVSGTKLKIDMSLLGVHWTEKIKSALSLLSDKPAKTLASFKK